jgi:hypothetical protein
MEYNQIDPEEIIERLKRIIESLQKEKNDYNEEKLFNTT